MRTGFGERLGSIACRLISWALIALCVWMIHGFSLQDAERSGALSLEVTDVVARLMQPEGKINRNADSFIQLHNYVRKGAHALEYALLAMAAMLALATSRMRTGRKLLLILILCAAFAGYDEWSQAMSLGRSPAIRDVAIDTAGALAGCLFALFVRLMTLWALGAAKKP